MKKRIKILLSVSCSVILLCIVGTWILLSNIFNGIELFEAGNRPFNEEDMVYIQNHVSLVWPQGTEFGTVSDNWIDGRFIARFSWPIEKAKQFPDQIPPRLMRDGDLDQLMGDENQGQVSEWVQLDVSGQHEGVFPFVYLNLASGKGLIEISYPDASGD